MNYTVAVICGIVASLVFGLTVPIEHFYLTLFIYLITFSAILIFLTLEDN